MRHTFLPLFMTGAMLFTSSLPAAEEKTDTAPAETAKKEKKKKLNWEEVDASEFGAKLDAASGEKWAASPESIVLEYAGPFITDSGEKMSQRRSISIRTKGEGIPKKLKITLTDDGLFDDSVKKSSVRLELKRNKKDGSWKLLKAYRATEKWAPPA